jgi:hypothetical protein
MVLPGPPQVDAFRRAGRTDPVGLDQRAVHDDVPVACTAADTLRFRQAGDELDRVVWNGSTAVYVALMARGTP